MLSARKLHLVAGLKVHGLDLRKAELDFYMMRYTMTAGISSIITGMAYVSVIKIKIPEYMRPDEMWFAWQVFAFYILAASTMCVALFNMVLTSFLVVNAQGMTLRGPPNAVIISVGILERNWPLARGTLIGCLALLFASTAVIFWMKLEESEWNPSPAIFCTAIFVGIILMAYQRMARMARELSIHGLVKGDLTLHAGQEDIDLTDGQEAVPTIVR